MTSKPSTLKRTVVRSLVVPASWQRSVDNAPVNPVGYPHVRGDLV